MTPHLPGGVSQVFDFASFFERTGSDLGLAQELIALLLRDLPTLVKSVNEAATARDATRLERSAHALKGAVSNFSAELSTKAAERLEVMGRQKDFDNVEKHCSQLESELERLKEALSHATPRT